MQNVQKMRHPEGRFIFQYVELAYIIRLAFACYLMLVGSTRVLLMYRACYFYSLLIPIQRFVTMEVKCVCAIILLSCLELLLLTTCSQESVFAQITCSVFWSGMLRCSVSAHNFVLCYLSHGMLQLSPRNSEIGVKQTALMFFPAFTNLAVLSISVCY